MRTRTFGIGDDEGAVAVVVALTLMVLMGMTAVAVDGGRLFVERSSVQNAADHAALAAAWEFCAEGDEAASVAAGLASAASNGMDSSSPTVEIAIEPLENDRWQATVASQIEAPFAAVLGKDTMATSGTAIAGCTPGAKPIEGTETTTVTQQHGYTIFAGGTCSSKTIDGSGSNLTINGNVHSNRSIDWGGSNNVVNGLGTYVNTATMDTSKITWNPSTDNPTKVSGTISYDSIVSYKFADYAPDGDIAKSVPPDQYHSKTGKWDLKKPIAPGIYYTPGDIVIGDSSLTAEVTLVAGGEIDISGSNVNLSPYHGDLLAFSNSNAGCDNTGIKMGGSTNKWVGTVYAPNAMIEYSGSVNSSVTGSLIGLHVRLNGSSSVFNYGGGGITTTVEGTEGAPGTDPVVDLLE
jgi:hypothetical protein